MQHKAVGNPRSLCQVRDLLKPVVWMLKLHCAISASHDALIVFDPADSDTVLHKITAHQARNFTWRADWAEFVRQRRQNAKGTP